MPKQLQHQLWIIAAAGIVFFANLGATALWDDDETIYASCAREMRQQGDWVVPRYNGQVFFDKPPLMFWTIIAGFEVFGPSEFAARFWSAVAGVATALVTYQLGRRLFRAEVGLWAGLIIASTLIFTVSARAATVDAALTLVTTLAVLLFVRKKGSELFFSGKPSTGPFQPQEKNSSAPFFRAWLLYGLMYACLGVAVLAKGPVGLLLPAAAIGLFLLIAKRFSPRAMLGAVWHMRPLTALLVVAAVALPWYVLVGVRTDGLWLKEFFAKYNVAPFVQPSLGHRGPFFYHFLVIFIGLFPWSVFLVPALVQAVRRLYRGHSWRTGYLLLACWIGVFFVFWSICSTKLPHYVLPAYPALALLTACWLDHWLTRPEEVSRWWLRAAAIGLIVVGLGIVVGIPVAAAFFVPGEEWLGLVGLILVAGGGLCLWYHQRSQPRQVLRVFAVASVAFVVGIFAVAAVRVDRHQAAAPLLAEVRADERPLPMVAYRVLPPSIVYYAGGPVPCFERPEPLGRFLEENRPSYLFTSDKHQAEIERAFPGVFQVKAQRPRFLRRGETLLVLQRREDFSPIRTAGTIPPRQ